jgi:glycosyltransferase involved in cell wall biosynthesis
MRILVVTLRYPPYVAGGYELLTFEAVAALRERGHDVTVLCGRGAALAGVPGVIPALRPALPEPGAEQNLFKLSHAGTNRDRLRLHVLRRANLHATSDALARTDADLMLYFNLGLVSLAPVLAARRARVSTLGYVPDPWPRNHWILDWRARAGAARPLKLALLERAWRRFRARVDLGPLLVSSAYLRAELAADGLPPADMTLLPLPLPPPMQPEPPVAAPPARAAGEPLRVACLSSLWEGKGQHVLLAAARDASARGADLALDLAGDGDAEYEDRLRALAADPALAGRVRFHGRVDRAGARRILDASHVLALPSVWGEPYPTATLEGMARGLTVLASDAGGTPEQIADGVDGCLVPAGDVAATADALVRLAQDDALRRRLGAAGLARVRRDATMERYTDGLERAALAAVLRGAR